MIHRDHNLLILLIIFFAGCAVIDKPAKPPTKPIISNEKLFADGMIAARDGDNDQASELFARIEKNHPLYTIGQEELERGKKRKESQIKKIMQKTNKPVDLVTAQQLEDYQKHMDEATAFIHKEEFDAAYLSLHLAGLQVAKDKTRFKQADSRKKEIEDIALGAIDEKLAFVRELERAHKYEYIVDILRPIAEVPLREQEIKNALASALHRLALINYENSRYGIAADLLKEEYTYRPDKSVKELSEKARRLADALESK